MGWMPRACEMVRRDCKRMAGIHKKWVQTHPRERVRCIYFCPVFAICRRGQGQEFSSEKRVGTHPESMWDGETRLQMNGRDSQEIGWDPSPRESEMVRRVGTHSRRWDQTTNARSNYYQSIYINGWLGINRVGVEAVLPSPYQTSIEECSQFDSIPDHIGNLDPIKSGISTRFGQAHGITTRFGQGPWGQPWFFLPILWPIVVTRHIIYLPTFTT